MTEKKLAYVSGTGGQYRLVLEREAIDVFAMDRLLVGSNGARALPVKFGKYRPVQALANAINQYMASMGVAVPPTPQELMAEAVKAGATFSDYMQADVKINPPSADDLALIQHARDCYQRDGDLEFDDLCVVSGGDHEDGDYVLCWKWVDKL